MYRNRPQHFTTSQQPTFKLPAFQEDNRLAFLDSVCATLMTSRFGWHEAATFPGGKRENHLRKRVSICIGQVMLISGKGATFAFLGHDGPTLKPPAHAGGSPSRGSPNISGTFLFASSFATLASFA